MNIKKTAFPEHDCNFIVPSILSADFSCLKKDIQSIEKYSGWIQIDVMDGHFVPNLSFGPHIASNVRKITNLPLDVHLMVEKPFNFVNSFYRSGANLITCHIESEDFLKAIKEIKRLGLKAGIALNPRTDFSKAIKYLKYVDLLLIMTVNPGFGGQEFISEMLEKIKIAKKFKDENKMKYYIQVDGGINENNIFKVLRAGANSIVMGSGLFSKDNPKFIKRLFDNIGGIYGKKDTNSR